MHQKLQQRYWQLVAAHLHSCTATTNAASAIGVDAAVASVAASRFWTHEQITPTVLAEPLLDLLRQQTQHLTTVLCVHDWCMCHFPHASKTDRLQRTHAHDVGYELLTAMLVDATTGQPLGVANQQLQTRHGIIRPHTAKRGRPLSHLEQLLPVMRAARTWRLRPRMVHVIDREADSVDHYRQWAAAGQRFLVRADDRSVRWQKQVLLLSEVTQRLRRAKAFTQAAAWWPLATEEELWWVETPVILHRPAKKNVGGKRWEKAGRALPLRFVISQIRRRGRVQVTWWLLSNVPPEWADSQRLLQWYYWRWQIESYHKLMKSAGQQVEAWLQRNGTHVAKRLSVANMACALVWRLQRNASASAEQLRELLATLSGRQQHAGKITTPALLDGLEKLLAVLRVSEQMSLADMKRLLEQHMPELFREPKQ